MTVQENVNVDMVTAMKNREIEKASLLKVVMGEFSRIGKVLSDEAALKEIRKMHENAKQLKNEFEINILGAYLPQMLNEIEIKSIVKTIIDANNFTTMKEMGRIMGELKRHPNAAQIDNSIASKIVKELLV